ncbi:putative Zn-dependent protease [Halospina denitrificans]|uniref:Putative Zn-dependent protease n=1 Tax=Halospina denitrificans TaxID=332522 RepID=A0A4R7JZK9_9GAMM|nr:M48 family metalloprotease [Halospina denitrificans]TDT43003.1 putative Zn-dependent protease [Halospina denitrificans]
MRQHPALRTLPLILLTALVLGGCTTNPVTGESQLRLMMSEDEEVAIGKEQYQPTLQIQGGRYYRGEELNAYVSEVGQSLARVSDRPNMPYEFTVINSGVPNAWALPGGKIAINRGLLVELDNEAQLAAVLGHEVVHAAASHSAQRMQRGMLINLGVAGIGLGVALSDNRYAPLIMGGAAVGSQLIMAQYSQAHELESDRYGMQYMAKAGYNPEAAVELQQVFVKLSEGGNNDFITGLFQSHPPSQERVEANRKIAKELGSTGEFYSERYEQKLAGLRRDRDAYTAYDKARKAMQEEEREKAMALIESAIDQVPNEAAFFSLRGDIRREMDNADQAMSDYNQAVELYPQMFRYRLNRGLLHREQENWESAEKDLKASLDSVQTSIAYLGLGDAVAAQGRNSEARQYYQRAAQDQGQIGELARQRLKAMGS